MVGFFSGLLSGGLGIGGGMFIIPALIILGLDHVSAVGTSSLAIFIISFFGTVENFSKGHLNFSEIIYMALGAMIAAYISTYIISYVNVGVAQLLFAILLICLPFLNNLKKSTIKTKEQHNFINSNPKKANIGIGAIGGVLAGFFGIGGGVVLVPLQHLLLGRQLKHSIVNSLGVIVFASGSASISYLIKNQIDFIPGLILGFGGLWGAKLSISYLPKMKEKWLRAIFNSISITISLFFIMKAYQNF